ncbi:MAG: hypothetical protein VKK04_21615 [Synechococcales bacterium]|nr:hypothetical protein [Synechococcales bacterium]
MQIQSCFSSSSQAPSRLCRTGAIAPSHAARAAQLKAKGWQAYHQGQYADALLTFRIYLMECQAMMDLAAIGDALNSIGAATLRLGDTTTDRVSQRSQAATCFRQALELANLVGNAALRGQSLIYLGQVSQDADLMENALQFYQQAVQAFATTHDEQLVGQALVELGVAYGRLNQYDQARHFCTLAANLLHDADAEAAEVTEAEAIYHAGVAAYEQSYYPKAIALLEQAVSIWVSQEDRHQESNALTWLGLAYQAYGQLRAALCYFWDAWVLSKNLGDRASEVMNLLWLGDIYDQEEMPLSALDAYRQAIALLDAPEHRQYLDLPTFTLAQMLDQAGELDQALDCYRQVVQPLKIRPKTRFQ